MEFSQNNEPEQKQPLLYDFSPLEAAHLPDELLQPVDLAGSKAELSAASISKKDNWQRKAGQAGSLFESFYHAFNGLLIGFRLQRNVRIHLCLATAVFAMAYYFKVHGLELITLVLSIGFVLFAEFVNTAIEHMVDIQTKFEYQLSARYAKDTAAAAVLLSALTAVIVGSIVFLPKLFALFGWE